MVLKYYFFFRPNIGDMVWAPNGDESTEDGIEWLRARILSVGKSGLYHVSLCDFGGTRTVKVVKQLSDNLASIPEFAARCTVISSTISRGKLWPDVSRNSALVRLLINCGLHFIYLITVYYCVI
jgi:hypothetical protein